MTEKKEREKGYQGNKLRAGVSIDAALLQQGKQQAKKESRSFSNLVEHLLRQYLAKVK